MKNLLLILLLGTFCQQVPPANAPCDVKQPLKELSWLKNKAAHYQNEGGSLTITQAQRQGETVFSIEYVLGADARETTYYRCNGSVICQSSVTIAGLTSDCLGDFPSDLTGRKMIYPETDVK